MDHQSLVERFGGGHVIDPNDIEIIQGPLRWMGGVFNARWGWINQDTTNCVARGPCFKQCSETDFLKECENILRLTCGNSIRHSCIESVWGVTCYNNIPYLITQQMDMTLSMFLQHTNFDEHVPHYEHKVKLVLNIANGLHYLHSRTPPIIHCALCCDSILIAGLLSSKVTAKISDLSQACEKGSVWKKPSTSVLPYLPPKYRVTSRAQECTGLQCHTHIDIYSLAAVIVSIETRQFQSFDTTEDITELMDKRNIMYEISNQIFNQINKPDEILTAGDVWDRLKKFEYIDPEGRHEAESSTAIPNNILDGINAHNNDIVPLDSQPHPNNIDDPSVTPIEPAVVVVEEKRSWWQRFVEYVFVSTPDSSDSIKTSVNNVHQ